MSARLGLNGLAPLLGVVQVVVKCVAECREVFQDEESLRARRALVFPAIPRVPFDPYRSALYSADERRFVRLRMFHPDAVSEAAIARAIHEHTELAPILVHDTVVARPQLDMVDGVAFMTWDETAGWTLDSMLARVRTAWRVMSWDAMP